MDRWICFFFRTPCPQNYVTIIPQGAAKICILHAFKTSRWFIILGSISSHFRHTGPVQVAFCSWGNSWYNQINYNCSVNWISYWKGVKGGIWASSFSPPQFLTRRDTRDLISSPEAVWEGRTSQFLGNKPSALHTLKLQPLLSPRPPLNFFLTSLFCCGSLVKFRTGMILIKDMDPVALGI